MFKKRKNNDYYKFIIILYVFQLVLIALFFNNNYMRANNLFQSVKYQELIDVILVIIIFIFSFASVFAIRKLYLSGKEHQEYQINSLKFKHIEEVNTIYRRFQHDFKNHINIISQLAREQRYEELNRYLRAYKEEFDHQIISVDIGSKELDILLNSKINKAKNKNILVEFKIKERLNISKKHILALISILANLLDNAIEACEELKTDRFINIKITADPIDFILIIKNSTALQVSKKEELVQEGFTTKESGTGEGLFIVNKLVEKLKGSLTLDIKDNEFCVKVELPRCELEEE